MQTILREIKKKQTRLNRLCLQGSITNQELRKLLLKHARFIVGYYKG